MVIRCWVFPLQLFNISDKNVICFPKHVFRAIIYESSPLEFNQDSIVSTKLHRNNLVLEVDSNFNSILESLDLSLKFDLSKKFGIDSISLLQVGP